MMGRWSERRPPEDFHRVLAPDGSVVGDPPDLDEDQLRHLYRTMRLTRALDEKMVKMQRRGQLGLASPELGEEATPAGTAAALEPGDWVFPYYRQKAAQLYWSVPAARIVAARAGFEPETIAEHVPPGDVPVTFTPNYTALGANVNNAAGSAMSDALVDGDAVTMAYVGDGATSEGDVHEGLNNAGVFEAPFVCVCQNNQWAISVPSHRQTAAETFADKAVAYGIEGERVDGNDVLAVYGRARDAVERARAGDGPTFLECVTYRRADHNTSDAASVYRDESEGEYWAERDPIDRFEAYLEERGTLDERAIRAIEEGIDAEIESAVARVEEIPESEPARMFDHQLHDPTWTQRHGLAELEVELAGGNPFTDFTGTELVDGGARTDGAEPAAERAPGSETEEMNLVTAVNEALRGEMERDESVRVIGYDVGPIGGVFRATASLYDEFGGDRVVDMPLSQNGVLGAAVGMAMRGERIVAEIQFMGFLYPAFGQLMYGLVKTYDRSAGRLAVPVTVRVPYGGGIKPSEYHSESTEALLVHVPGVRVVCPSTPREAKGLLAASVRHPDPVVFMESTKLYREGHQDVPREPYTLPLDEARLVQEGTDVTVIAWGTMVRHAEVAAERVDADVEVMDLRVLSPVDVPAVLESVRKTGRCVVLHEARRTLGLGAELSALLNEYALDHLHAPIKRATGFDVHFPGHQIEEDYLPDADRAERAIEAVMDYDF